MDQAADANRPGASRGPDPDHSALDKDGCVDPMENMQASDANMPPSSQTKRERLRRLSPLLTRFRSHFANLTAFTVLQAVSYLIPVVTIPYFARVLTIAGMGQLAIAGAVALVAGVLMDFAIQLSGTRYAAKHADDTSALAAYLSTSSTLKLAILLPIVVALTASSFFLSQVAQHFWIFFWSLMAAATMCLFPQWLFQGLLAMPLAARILVSCRVAAAAAGLLLVRSSADAFVVPMTQALGSGVALVLAAGLLKRRLGIIPGRSSLSEVADMIRGNLPLFSATAWGAAYSHGAVIIMSTMLPAASIGFYSIAQKISQAFVSMFNVAAQTGFPVFVRVRDAAVLGRRVRLYIAAVVGAATIALGAMFLVREPTYVFFAGQHSDTGVTVFSLWLVMSLFTIISVSLSPVMVVLHLDDQMARVYRFIGLTFLVMASIACAYFGVLGMTSALLVTEGCMALFFVLGVRNGLRRINDRGAR